VRALSQLSWLAAHLASPAGRIVTAQGMRDLDRIAGRVAPAKADEE